MESSDKGSKVPKYGGYMASIPGIVASVFGIYFVFGYLDPSGRGRTGTPNSPKLPSQEDQTHTNPICVRIWLAETGRHRTPALLFTAAAEP